MELVRIEIRVFIILTESPMSIKTFLEGSGENAKVNMLWGVMYKHPDTKHLLQRR